MKPDSHPISFSSPASWKPLLTAAVFATFLWASPLWAQDDAAAEAEPDAAVADDTPSQPRVITTTSEPIRVTPDSVPANRVVAITPEDLGFFMAQIGMRGRPPTASFTEEEQQAFLQGVQTSVNGTEPSPEVIGFLVAQQIGLAVLEYNEEELNQINAGLVRGLNAGINGREEAIQMSERISGYLRARQQGIEERRRAQAQAAQEARALSQAMMDEIKQEWQDRGPIRVTLQTTEGDITLELMPDRAPLAVANFVTHIENDYYDGIIFHRVIDGFMIQGGDPQGTGIGGESVWGKPFPDEVHEDLSFTEPYILAMANAGPTTNGSQFFITVAPTPHLNLRHTIFGKVVEGKKVVDTIAKTRTGANDKPAKDIVIEDAKVLEAS